MVRVKLEIKIKNLVKNIIAIVNSGYEADTPQLMIPATLARELNLWPPPPDSRELVFDTAGGPVKVWFVPRIAKARVLGDNVSSKEVVVDLVISTSIDEPLISDLLTSEFEIVIEDPYKGLWRFRWEEPGKIRMTERKPS
ncbi:MAG: hypothetical protein B6U89_06475 [Desulfurococcales archaeon ex4484_58]|nr:MAG: hypothetical protein B6U89_06475 [Desulfurococcales archaeon ex4484_58]